MSERFERVRHAALRTLCVLLGLLALLFVLPRSAAASSRATVQTSGAESRFAIADFDGDVRPDFASIRGDLNGSGDVNYWIQLQLSEAGQQSIHLVGPAGGLSIQARDVNGDHIPDLLLATEWSKRPVAILLNDGHGNFSRVAPDEFPSAFTTANQNWSSVAAPNSRSVRPSVAVEGERLYGREGPLPRPIAYGTYRIIDELLPIAVPFQRQRWPRSSPERSLLVVLSIVLQNWAG